MLLAIYLFSRALVIFFPPPSCSSVPADACRLSEQVEIRGTSIVPDVTVSTHELDYGDCFLQYPYKKVIELVNHSDLPAKFQLETQDEISQCVAVYEVDYQKGE